MELTHEQIDRAARAAYEAPGSTLHSTPWNTAPQSVRENYYAQLRAAAPFLQMEPDEVELARAVDDFRLWPGNAATSVHRALTEFVRRRAEKVAPDRRREAVLKALQVWPSLECGAVADRILAALAALAALDEVAR